MAQKPLDLESTFFKLSSKSKKKHNQAEIVDQIHQIKVQMNKVVDENTRLKTQNQVQSKEL